jgi:hypothetical protein
MKEALFKLPDTEQRIAIERIKPAIHTGTAGMNSCIALPNGLAAILLILKVGNDKAPTSRNGH